MAMINTTSGLAANATAMMGGQRLKPLMFASGIKDQYPAPATVRNSGGATRSIPTASNASSKPVAINEPTMMKVCDLKLRASLISPFCCAEYVAHCRDVHAMGATSRVAIILNGG